MNREEKIRQLAKDEYEVEGEIEIDSNATLSEGDDKGCYVSAWVWVSFADTEFDKDAETRPSSDALGEVQGASHSTVAG